MKKTHIDGSESVREIGNSGAPHGPTPRVLRAERDQVMLRPASLDLLVAEDHPVRAVWEFAEQADLSCLYSTIRAVDGKAGRPATDPRILLALWIYATLKAVGSARELDRLCREHQAFQWLCGDVEMNYHTLADFRVGQMELLDRLLTKSVAGLTSQGLVTLESVAQDGMRTRASAGAASFRRRKTLEDHMDEARKQVEALRNEVHADPSASNRRQIAARQRAIRERAEKVAAALVELEEAEKKRKPSEQEKARASETDAEATVMKMADGGFRPAYNVQFATDAGTQIIVGVDVNTNGTDHGAMPPMVDQVVERCGKAPEEYLVDGGFVVLDDIESVTTDHKCTVFAPVKIPANPTSDPHAPKKNDSQSVGDWRVRMGTEAAKRTYKLRAQTAECVNAIARNRGLTRFVVRGLKKVRSVALLYALAHNVYRMLTIKSPAAVVA